MATLEKLQREVLEANLGIYRGGLVTEHAGNASGIDRKRGLVVIKPSGVDYLKMRASDMVVTDLAGRKVKGKYKPSVDLPHHIFLYKHCPEIGGVIHTHSNYATSFALLGRPIPVCLTAIADEFGEDIPCMPYVDNLGDHIGETILKFKTRAPGILLGQHGTFSWGPNPREALKAAVMLEDVAKTVHLAMLLGGEPKRLPPEEVKKWWDRYHTTYGQPKEY